MKQYGGSYGSNNNSGENMSRLEKKKQVIKFAMYETQPDFDDFERTKGFSPDDIKKDRRRLKDKLARIKQENRNADEFAEDMEPVLTYALTDQALFPTRQNFAFLASEFDDKCNGTDIVFGVQRKDGGISAFGVDVATGTNMSNIQKKYRTSFDNHDGVSNLDYCSYRGDKWKEKDAPHFILGMSPASQNAAIDKILVNNDMLQLRKEDKDSDFIILSEMFEQISLHLALLNSKDQSKDLSITTRINKLKDLQPAVVSGLRRVLGIERGNYSSAEEMQKDLGSKYHQRKLETARKDMVYNNIIQENNSRIAQAKERAASKARGNLSMKATTQPDNPRSA